MRQSSFVFWILTAVALGVGLPAQRMWTVEPSGRGDFKRIADAIAAAKSGDRILVGPGRYAETPRVSKGLHVLGYSAVVNGFFVHQVMSGSSVTLSGFEIDPGGAITLQDNSGHVALHGCTLFDLSILGSRGPRGLIVKNCKHVTVYGCDFRGRGSAFENSDAYVTQSRFAGRNASRDFIGNIDPQEGLLATRSHVVLGATQLRGGNGMGFPSGQWPRPALRSIASVITVGVRSELLAGRRDHSLLVGYAPAVQGDSATKLYADPSVRAEASDISIPVVLGTTPVLLTIPSVGALVTRTTSYDYLIEAEVIARPRWMTGLLVGVPGKRQLIDSIGDLWIDTMQPLVLLGLGPTASDWTRKTKVLLPRTISVGVPVTLQSLLLEPGRQSLRLSVPLTVVLR